MAIFTIVSTIHSLHWSVYLYTALFIGLLYILKPLLFPSPLDKIPGPSLARYTNLWAAYECSRGHSETLYRELHARYGPYVRIGPKRVIFNNPELIPKVYGVNSNLVKAPFYTAFEIPFPAKPWPDMPNPGVTNIFATADLKYHKYIKSAIVPAYSFAALKTIEPAVDKLATLFFDRVTALAKDGSAPVDLGLWFHYYAFDVVGTMSYLKPFGFLEKGRDEHNLIEQLGTGMAYSSTVAQAPWIHRLLLGNSFFTRTLASLGTTMSPAVVIRDLVHECLSEYDLDSKVERGDTYEYLRKVRAGNPDKITEQEIVETLINNVFGGADTTSIGLRGNMYELLNNPATYAALQQEVDDADASGLLSTPIQHAEGSKLTYLQAVIKETLRLNPGIPMALDRVVPSSGLPLSEDLFLPPGSTIGASPSAININAEAFAPDPLAFRPERWLTEDVVAKQRMERAWFTFGGGTRLCIGRNIAMFEMTKLLPEVVRRWDVSWAKPEERKNWSVDGYFLALQHGLTVRIKERKKNEVVDAST